VVGLEISLDGYEYLYREVGLAPYFPLVAWRGGVPVYKDDRQIGHATTGAWSPSLKKYIALATIEKEFLQPGTRLDLEVTIEHKRKTAGATVVKLPFFDPPRKRALFAPSSGR
jgi:aminomethyltransferase